MSRDFKAPKTKQPSSKQRRLVVSLYLGYNMGMSASPIQRQELHRLIDELDEKLLPEAAEALQSIGKASPADMLRGISGLQMPDHWPPRFVDFEPLPVSGELPSAQLIRERR